jgi:aminomethyltransferase
VAFQTSSRRAPRHDYEIYFAGEGIGTVTSGVYSPYAGCGIGLGFVRPDLAVIGTELEVRHERIGMTATVCELPFYKAGSLRI